MTEDVTFDPEYEVDVKDRYNIPQEREIRAYDPVTEIRTETDVSEVLVYVRCLDRQGNITNIPDDIIVTLIDVYENVRLNVVITNKETGEVISDTSVTTHDPSSFLDESLVGLKPMRMRLNGSLNDLIINKMASIFNNENPEVDKTLVMRYRNTIKYDRYRIIPETLGWFVRMRYKNIELDLSGKQLTLDSNVMYDKLNRMSIRHTQLNFTTQCAITADALELDDVMVLAGTLDVEFMPVMRLSGLDIRLNHIRFLDGTLCAFSLNTLNDGGTLVYASTNVSVHDVDINVLDRRLQFPNVTLFDIRSNKATLTGINVRLAETGMTMVKFTAAGEALIADSRFENVEGFKSDLIRSGGCRNLNLVNVTGVSENYTGSAILSITGKLGDPQGTVRVVSSIARSMTLFRSINHTGHVSVSDTEIFGAKTFIDTIGSMTASMKFSKLTVKSGCENATISAGRVVLTDCDIKCLDMTVQSSEAFSISGGTTFITSQFAIQGTVDMTRVALVDTTIYAGVFTIIGRESEDGRLSSVMRMSKCTMNCPEHLSVVKMGRITGSDAIIKSAKIDLHASTIKSFLPNIDGDALDIMTITGECSDSTIDIMGNSRRENNVVLDSCGGKISLLCDTPKTVKLTVRESVVNTILSGNEVRYDLLNDKSEGSVIENTPESTIVVNSKNDFNKIAVIPTDRTRFTSAIRSERLYYGVKTPEETSE